MELDWDALAAEMLATGEFHPDGLNAITLKRDYEKGYGAIRTEGSRIIAYASVEDRTFDPHYPTYEIRRVFVAKDKNGSKTAEELIAELIKRFTPPEEELPRRVPTFFLISKNPAIWHIAMSLGFRAVTKFRMPNVREWAKRAGLGKRLPRSATARDPHHSNRRKRWLYMR
ncbi:GNAT family N-acetyltransferase [Candidatus Kaiserbacteria bacterium]|nr:GNAT family N-acetyltransferase [Candidatus Kaiserbacteria bacterium]